MNEVHIIAIIVTVFVLLGVTIPYVNQAMGESVSNVDTDGLQDSLTDEIQDDLNAGDIALSVLKMFFWTFGDIHPIFDSILLIFRIILIVAIVKVLPFT